MINYPSKPYTAKNVTSSRKKSMPTSAANRGMQLEKIINAANDYYLMHDIALITKRPTPINVVKIDYTKGATITNAYFEKQSTTDYNGLYQNRYLDFEAKSTQLKTSFPVNNISNHQITHLENVIKHGGIAFFIIEFALKNEVYVLPASFVIATFKADERKSIPYSLIKENGIQVPYGMNPILNYLPAVIKLFSL